MNRMELLQMLNKEKEKYGRGFFLPESSGYQAFADLDGTTARKWLEERGFRVIKNYDTGRNGWAVTSCGIHLSTNGYVYKKF